MTTFGLCAKSYFAPNGDRVRVKGSAMFPRSLSPGPVWADATPAPERSRSHGRVCHSTLLLSALPGTGAGGAFLPRPGFGRFPPFAGERKTLTNP